VIGVAFAHQAPRARAAGNPELLRESIPAASLYLPPPGQSHIGQLSPDLKKSQDKAIAEAERGAWASAITDLDLARMDAYCAPSLVYNLAVAYEGKGDLARAAVFYRAYLAELPEARDAAAIKADLERIKRKLQDDADRYADEAERLAGALNATPARPGAKSLREAQYEEMARFYFALGQVSRAERIVGKLRSIPTVGNYSDSWADPHRQTAGALPALMRGDRDGFLHTNYAGVFTAILDARQGDAEGALRALQPDPPLMNSWNDLVTALSTARAHAALALVYGRALRNTRAWDSGWFGGATYGAIRLFWDGGPDLAADLAGQLRSYFQRNDIGYQRLDDAPRYLADLALLGDLDTLDYVIRRRQYDTYWMMQWVSVDEIAAILAATRPDDPERVTHIVKELEGLEYETIRGESAHPRNDEVLHPAAEVVLALLHGNDDRAQSILQTPDVLERAVSGVPHILANASQGSDLYDGNDNVGRLLLRFAVLTRRKELALRLAEHRLPGTALYELRRLALTMGPAGLEATLDSLEEAVCQGWRPRDDHQARLAWSALERADDVTADDKSFTFTTVDELKRAARDKPDALPDMVFDAALEMYLALAEIDAQPR